MKRGCWACLLGVLGLFALSGCAQRLAFGDCADRVSTGECYRPPVVLPPDGDLVATTRQAAVALLAPLSATARQQRLLVSSLADINALETTSALGRLLAESLAAGFIQAGMQVVEPRLRNTLLIQQNQGEFMLSRDFAAISQAQAVDLLAVGTYAVGQQQVYINLRLLNRAGVALASHAFVLPLGADTERLLHEPA